MRPLDRTADRELARQATAAHGLVTRKDLLAAGVTVGELKHRLGTGALIAVHRGVYRVGHRAPSVEARYLAAVLAGGEGALLTGRAAAHLTGLLKGPPPAPEVAAPRLRRIEGAAVRQYRTMDPLDTTVVRAIPATTVARTLTDLAAVLPAAELARACHEAGVRYRITPSDVEAVMTRRPRAAGSARLRSVIQDDVPVTLSKLERRFLDLLSAAGLPLPETNRVAGGRRVDCRWPDHCLTVELDSYRYHSSRHAWEQDRHREREARLRGDDFRRYTYGDVFDHPRLMLAELHLLFSPTRRN